MRQLIHGVSSILACFAAQAAHAQTITTLMLEGDPVSSGGTVREFLSVDVNNSGSWTVTLDSDPNTMAGIVTMLDGVVLYLENDQILTTASGTFMGGLGPGFDLNDEGQTCAGILLAASPTGAQFGLVHNEYLVLDEGDVVFATGAPPGSTYLDFTQTWMGAGDRFLVHAHIPSAALPNAAALMKIEHDGGFGLLDQQFAAKTGDVLPGQVSTVMDFGMQASSHDLNRLGQVAMTVAMAGSASVNTAIYVDDELVIQEGSASGVVGGQDWGDLHLARVDLNNRGQLAFHARLANFDNVIVFDGRMIARHGAQVPGLAPGVNFVDFGQSAPVLCSDSGDVAHFARWFIPGFGNQSGLYVADQRVLLVGALTNGLVFDSIDEGADGFRMSDDGRYIIFQGELAGGTAGVFLIDRGVRPATLCLGDGTLDVGMGPVSCPCLNHSAIGAEEGCRNSTGKGAQLTATGSLSAVAADTVFSVRHARPLQPGLLVQGAGNQVLPFKDGLFCMGNPTWRIEVAFTDASGFAQTSGDVAALGNSGPGTQRFFQYWFRDPAVSVCGTGSNFSQAITFVWQ